MGVPNTNTFSLQDVVNEVNPTTNDLVDCFSDATSSDFDPNYSGSKNSLINFRNYDGVTYFSYNAVTQSTSSGICALTSNQLIYQIHSSAQAFDFNDPIYSNTSGTLAPAGWWKISVLYRYWDGSNWTGTTQSC